MTRVWCWLRNIRMESDWRIDRARDLNEQQVILTEATGNFLRDRYTGQWEGNRDA